MCVQPVDHLILLRCQIADMGVAGRQFGAFRALGWAAIAGIVLRMLDRIGGIGLDRGGQNLSQAGANLLQTGQRDVALGPTRRAGGGIAHRFQCGLCPRHGSTKLGIDGIGGLGITAGRQMGMLWCWRRWRGDLAGGLRRLRLALRGGPALQRRIIACRTARQHQRHGAQRRRESVRGDSPGAKDRGGVSGGLRADHGRAIARPAPGARASMRCYGPFCRGFGRNRPVFAALRGALFAALCPRAD